MTYVSCTIFNSISYILNTFQSNPKLCPIKGKCVSGKRTSNNGFNLANNSSRVYSLFLPCFCIIGIYTPKCISWDNDIPTILSVSNLSAFNPVVSVSTDNNVSLGNEYRCSKYTSVSSFVRKI